VKPWPAIRLARPEHWIKNLIVLLPVVFSLRMGEVGAWGRAAVATAAFCLASSAAYVLNDIRDRHRDRKHPAKKDRPLAAGAIGVGAAAVEGMLILAAALAVAAAAGPLILGFVGAYLLLQLAYSFALKRAVLLDVVCLALGFVLRAGGGAVAIGVVISPWLVVCTFTICLFMGFCKRYGEALVTGSADAPGEHRTTLIHYTPELLTHLITVSAAVAVVAYLLYASNPRTIKQFGTNYLIYTLPVVVYGVFRFAMLSMRGAYAGPTELVLRDRPFQAAIAVWLAAVLAVLLYGQRLQELARGYLRG